jgi:hypothetical protein
MNARRKHLSPQAPAAREAEPVRLNRRTQGFVVLLVLTGLSIFLLAVSLEDIHVNGSRQFARAGYCSVSGNTAADGSPLNPGTFLDLLVGEPDNDGHYSGATLAILVKGIGLTCAGPPAGYVRHGFAADATHVGTGSYPYYVPAGG